MFFVERKELVIGGNIWYLDFDPNNTDIDSLDIPQQFIYTGRFSNTFGDEIILEDPCTKTKKHIAISGDYAIYETGFKILSHRRIDIFSKINRLAKKSSQSPDITLVYMAREYLKKISKSNPEMVI